MSRPLVLAPYPWHALARHDGAVLAAVRDARRAVQAVLAPDRAGSVIAELLDVPCRVTVHAVRPAAGTSESTRVRVVLRRGEGGLAFSLDLDPGLVTAAVARLLGPSKGIEAPRAPVPAALVGAAEAIVLEVARRLNGSGAAGLELWDRLDPGPGVAVNGTVQLDGRAYPFDAFVRWDQTSPSRPDPATVVGRLGDLPVRLPLVVGECWGTWRDLGELRPGDAWSCGGGLWIDLTGAGQGALAAPLASRGPRVSLASDGAVVLVGGARELALDVEEVEVAVGTQDDDSVTEAICDAPLVVRVELGSVAMSAREWVELRPGDVIRTDHRIASPVILRVAGRDVARGELVDVDGDLAVRILSLSVTGGGT